MDSKDELGGMKVLCMMGESGDDGPWRQWCNKVNNRTVSWCRRAGCCTSDNLSPLIV